MIITYCFVIVRPCNVLDAVCWLNEGQLDVNYQHLRRLEVNLWLTRKVSGMRSTRSQQREYTYTSTEAGKLWYVINGRKEKRNKKFTL